MPLEPRRLTSDSAVYLYTSALSWQVCVYANARVSGFVCARLTYTRLRSTSREARLRWHV